MAETQETYEFKSVLTSDILVLSADEVEVLLRIKHDKQAVANVRNGGLVHAIQHSKDIAVLLRTLEAARSPKSTPAAKPKVKPKAKIKTADPKTPQEVI